MIGISGPARGRVLEAFDEAAYLAFYPDVADAVAAGVLGSGWDHFVRFGLDEGRQPCPAPRRARLLGSIEPGRSRGVEIGPLDNPAVRKTEGDIRYVDHTDRAGLIRNFPHLAADPSALVEVDAVWGEKRLQDCLPGPVDYVVASHVIEHVPDLLGWLGEVRAILAPGGQLRLAIPDRRYSFDILRRESDLADVLDAGLREARVPLPRAVLEFLLWTRPVSARDAWLGQVDTEALRRRRVSARDALGLAGEVLAAGRYIDSHCWIFTPRSFGVLMEELSAGGLLGFECLDFHDTAVFDYEFFVGLGPCDDPAHAASTWRGMQSDAK
ncbi:MAG: hypothetical protein NVSMB18_04120 [Acetobacteraceae bacterium]